MFSVSCFVCFFFFKQKTAYDMRISDWSSDVCSSDLARSDEQQRGEHGHDAQMLIAGRIEPEERRRRDEPHPALRRQREREQHEDQEQKAARRADGDRQARTPSNQTARRRAGEQRIVQHLVIGIEELEEPQQQKGKASWWKRVLR